MKYASQAPHYLETEEEMEATFQNATFLKYPIHFPLKLTLRNVKKTWYGDGIINNNPKIPFCQFLVPGTSSPNKITACNLFSRSITNEGLGFTFNGPNFWDMHHRSTYGNIFARIMYPKGSNILKRRVSSEDLTKSYKDAGVVLPHSSGPLYGLNIALSPMHLYGDIRENITYEKPTSHFKVLKTSVYSIFIFLSHNYSTYY